MENEYKQPEVAQQSDLFFQRFNTDTFRDKDGKRRSAVIDPILERFWGLYGIEYCDDEEPEYNLLPTLVRRGIDFRYPEEWKEHVENAKKEVKMERQC